MQTRLDCIDKLYWNSLISSFVKIPLASVDLLFMLQTVGRLDRRTKYMRLSIGQ
jgi:hypothetical protein